jgi:hypothetical protein
MTLKSPAQKNTNNNNHQSIHRIFKGLDKSYNLLQTTTAIKRKEDNRKIHKQNNKTQMNCTVVLKHDMQKRKY